MHVNFKDAMQVIPALLSYLYKEEEEEKKRKIV